VNVDVRVVLLYYAENEIHFVRIARLYKRHLLVAAATVTIISIAIHGICEIIIAGRRCVRLVDFVVIVFADEHFFVRVAAPYFF
jgi:hypothetical protein